MDAHALAVLELPAIVERLAAEAATAQGRELARSLVPSAEPGEVTRRQALTSEAVELAAAGAEPVLAGASDIAASVEHTARGGAVDPLALRRIADTVRVGLAVRAALAAESDRAPLLAELAAVADPALAGLADVLAASVDDDGSNLRDSASPRLRALRRELRDGRRLVGDELRRLARTAGVREHLQEEFVTERAGRPVLAVKAGGRAAVKGIVHDVSGSGQTLFVEPFAVVDLNNRLREAEGAERDEVERILALLSARVAEAAGPLTALSGMLAGVDLALASGTLSRRWRGAAVEVADEVRLHGARHPLLPAAAAVPIDLDLGSLRALVVSGPNTGGKTVALKTVGLAALLHQSGLRVPADSVTLPVFDRVLADIGDEQSIAMSLSTFSGHLRNLVAIMDAATPRSLVLLDEVAAGTDPVEGAALAQALMARLARQARLTVATSHYAELKEWASATPGAANAATGFDPGTQAPLYRVTLGRPGTSHALQIAERLGLDPEVVAGARERIAPERLRTAELLAEAQAAERAAAEALAAADREREGAAAAAGRVLERERELAGEIDAVRASARRERELAHAEVERDLAGAREELAALREEIRLARRRELERRRAAPGVARTAERERDRRLAAAAERSAHTERALRELDAPVVPSGPLAAGDPVVAPGLGVRGTIVSIERDEAVVEGAGGLRVRLPLARLSPDARPREAGGAPPPVRVVAAASAEVADELDVRGLRAQEAREAVRAFVDAASLAGLAEVRVVHGRGTGAVRQAVREELARHPLAGDLRSDSADGATAVSLR